MTVRAVNPFATRHVRPGAVPFLFPPGASIDALLDRLERHHGWGQIIGPHGTGKSTLLAGLLEGLARRGRRTLVAELHDGHRRLPEAVWRALAPGGGGLQVVIDGYEQLGFWTRRRLKAACRRDGHGLLVTAHRSVGLPDLYRTHVAPDCARRVLEHLLAGEGRPLVDDDDLAACLTARGGNLREALFDLYDLWEQRRRQMG